MNVDENAPVFARSEIQVEAAPEIVWGLMADIEGWPVWNPDVKSASLRGEVTEGTEFRWKAGPGTITSTLRRVDPPRLMAWTGKTLGIRAIHVWRLEPRDGKTLVRTEESWEGLLSRVLRGAFQRTLEKALTSGLQSLKREAERRSGP